MDFPLAEVSSAPAGTTPALAIAGLSYAFGASRVLDAVSLSVAPGDFTVLLGLNGAGKTTLFALVSGLYYSRQGSIRVLGHDIRREPAAALARMGIVFQQPTMDLDLTVEQNLFYHASLHGLPRRAAAPRIARELERVGLAERRRERVRRLSGGQRRRAELARALVHEPSLLLLDEPTVGLDIASRQFLIEHVRHLCGTRQVGVLWATHLIDEAVEEAKVVVLHRGHVLARGDRHAVTAMHGGDLRAAFDRLVQGAGEA